MLILSHTCSQSNTCPLCDSFLTGACSKETFGLKRGKSNWRNLAVWAILNTGADYILSWWPAHISLSGKRCVKVCVCVRAHTSFHEVSLTSQTLVRKGPGSGLSPHTGTARGCSHRSACRCTDVHLFHTRLYLREKNGSESNRNRTEIDRCLRMFIDSVQRLWLWKHREVGVRS